MAIFVPKAWVDPLVKNVNFSTVWTSCFYSLERRFFVLEYCKRHFPSLYCLKNKLGKMAILWPKAWVKPFGKIWTFWLLNFFYSLKRSFFVLQYRKRHFPGLYCEKKKVGKMAIFGPKAWVNPFGKMSIFRIFQLLFFLSQERRLLVLEYRKRQFPV